ncbi:hypothetical protein BH23ACT5_BH23ACT5_20260 [soil metagenome]
MQAGTAIIWGGVVLVIVGAIVRWAPWAISWFGNLPGDIRRQGERTTLFIPITSMVVVSIVASAVLALLRRLSG